MKRLLTSILILFIINGYSQNESEFLHVEGQNIVDVNGKNVLLKGIGLGGYMLQEGYMLKVPFSGQQYIFKEHVAELIGEEKTEDFYNRWRSGFIQKKDIDSLKKWGFNSVRLPMHYNLYTLPVEKEPVKGENTWIETGFTLTDSLVQWCGENDLYLILDMHAAPGGQGHDLNISDRDPSKPSLWESQANQDKLVALWKKIAKRYKNEKVVGAYDIINEPNWSFDESNTEKEGVAKNGVMDNLNKPLKDLMIRITKVIREEDENHIIIIEGNGWGNNYNGILPPWDPNMVISFHKYWTYNTQKEIQQFLDIREKYNIPLWLGESGENSNTWFADAIELMEENNIGWCWWPLKKIGINNPLEIKINPGYQKILKYWNDEGSKPSEEEAYDAFMQLADNTKIENCIIHYDVIDAMIRQPGSDNSLPYKKVIVTGETEIPASDYDLGKNGIAYKDNGVANYWVSNGNDNTDANLGYTYRNDGVDIYNSEDNLLYVGNTEEGEWLQYTFTTKAAGNYNISFKISSEGEPGNVLVNIDDAKAGELQIPDTSGNWSWVSLDNISLEEGKSRLKFYINKGGFKFEKIRFEPVE